MTTVGYDAANRLKSVTDPAGSTVYEYDKNSNHTQVTDARGNVTGYSYDGLNRRTGISYPGGASESFSYDAAGNLLTHTDGNRIVVSYTYDALDRETNRGYSASDDGLSSIVTGYDANNNNVVAVTQNGAASRVSSYAFDSFDRQQKHTDPFGAVATTSYDANGNKTSLITQDGKVSRYTYDALNRVGTIVGQSGTVTYGYDRSSLNTSIGYGNGVASSMVYDLACRTARVTHAKAGQNLSLTQYEYDLNGNRSKETINRKAGAQVTTYGYDGADRLLRTSVVEAAKTVTTEYTLDAVANRLSETVTTLAGTASTVAARTYQYDGRNQLTGITDGAAGDTVLSYDQQGNMTQKQQGGDQVVYRYNARDNLISVARNGTVLGRYGNDHLGLRVEKEAKDPLQPGAPPVLLRTLWDGRSAFLDSTIADGVVARYDTDGRRPVGLWSKLDGVQALHHDALGSVVATTDDTGALKSETIYDAWGNVQQATGESANKFGYTGHQMDKESGLIYFQARYYDPSIGRFITQDPFEGDWQTPLSLHHYLYAYGNPTVYVDLYGYANQTFTERAKYSSGGVVGVVSGAAISTAKGFLELAKMMGDAQVSDPMRGLDLESRLAADQRLMGRGKAIGHAITHPAEMKDRFDSYVDSVESEAAKKEAAGKAFSAGFDRGYLGGEIGSAVVPVGGAAIDLGRIATRSAAKIGGVGRNGKSAAETVPSPSEVAPSVPRTAAARSDVGVTKEGSTKEVAIEQTSLVSKSVVKSKIFITYEFKNSVGEVVYVGRASGTGTPEQVMRQRLAKGHDVYEANPGLTAEVHATQGSASANKGAEGVLYERRIREGASLLNDPKSPPLSSKPAKVVEVREKISDYSEDLKH